MVEVYGIELAKAGSSLDVVVILTMNHVFYCLRIVFREIDDSSLCLSESIAACSFEES